MNLNFANVDIEGKKVLAYKRRNMGERFFQRIKNYRHIYTRFDKFNLPTTPSLGHQRACAGIKPVKSPASATNQKATRSDWSEPLFDCGLSLSLHVYERF